MQARVLFIFEVLIFFPKEFETENNIAMMNSLFFVSCRQYMNIRRAISNMKNKERSISILNILKFCRPDFGGLGIDQLPK